MQTTKMRFGSMTFLAVAVVAASACGGGGSGGSRGGTSDRVEGLARFASCDDLRDALVADARAKIEVQATALRNADFLPRAGEPTPVATPAPGATSSPGGSVSGPRDFTDTNTQVPGVDEADVVETDGTHLYLLHGTDLLILDAWPPETTRLRVRFPIEGTPLGMFVADGRAVVVSSVSDDGALGGTDACRVLGPAAPMPVNGFVPTCIAAATKVTLADVTNVDQPRVVRELYVEGSYVSARRHGAIARIVVRGASDVPTRVPSAYDVVWRGVGPRTSDEYQARIDDWEAQALAALDATSVTDWLPLLRSRVDGRVVESQPSCGDVHVPPPALAGDGSTRIVAFDMRADDGAVHDTVVLGGTDSIFASDDTLVLAQADWSWQQRGDSEDRTALHVFALSADPPATTYVASGFVPGAPLSQFAFDARDGTIRIATTITTSEGDFVRPDTASRVTVVRVAGSGLETVGATEDLAPGERMFGVRFVGTRAYLVTFRQVDPLFVVELADPAQPRVLGEVTMPGFSTYLQPIDDGHLLTVGVDEDRAVTLRIFDVDDPAMPRVAHAQALAGEGGSPAAFDHLAFTFNARLALLALPYTRYTSGGVRSTLVLVDVDVNDGFHIRGEIDHQQAVNILCPGAEPCFPGPSIMERGLFIDDFVYSISAVELEVHAVADLKRITSVFLATPFPAPPGTPIPVVTPDFPLTPVPELTPGIPIPSGT